MGLVAFLACVLSRTSPNNIFNYLLPKNKQILKYRPCTGDCEHSKTLLNALSWSILTKDNCSRKCPMFTQKQR